MREILRDGLRARDVMRRDVVTVRPDLPLAELARLLGSMRITGAPVVDAAGAVVGVVSQTDLIRRRRRSAPRQSSYYWDLGQETLRRSVAERGDPAGAVGDIMTRTVIAVPGSAPLRSVARLMLRRRVHRALVLDGGRLSGIVTSTDMLRGLLELLDRYEPISRR